MKTAQQVKVYHTAFEQNATEVAQFTPVTATTEVRDALEIAYKLTQNIQGSWSRSEWVGDIENLDYDSRVTVIGGRIREMGLRSTSVGDAAEVVIYNTATEMFEREYFILTSRQGWERVLSFEFDAYLAAQDMMKCMVRDGAQARKIAMGEAA